MAHKVEDVPVRNAGLRRVPWDEYADGDWWQLKAGEDYEPGTERALSSTARSWAWRKGYLASIRLGSATVYLRFIKKAE